jgi:hypothetical protein
MNSVSIDSTRAAAALSILDREKADLDRERAENPLCGDDRPFKWLNWVGYGNVIVASLVGIAWSLLGLLVLKETFWYVVYVYIWTSILFSFLPGMTFAFMIGLNWCLVLDVRRLSLAGTREAAWAGQRAKRRALNVVTLLVGPALWCWGLFFMAFVLLGDVPEKPQGFIFPERGQVALAVFLCFLWTLLAGFVYLWLHFLRSGEERLRVVTDLQSSLSDSAEKPKKMSRKDYNEIVRYERTRISRERDDSVRSFSRDDVMAGADQELSEFSILYTREAQAARDKLPEEEMAALQTIENELSATPKNCTHHITKLSEGKFIYKYPKPAIELTYELDEDKRAVYVIRVDVLTLPPTKLFISYAKEDKEWLVQVKTFLEPLKRDDLVELWDDGGIMGGERWPDKIQNALSSADAALLLVTQDFVNSEFITENELPHFLKAAEEWDDFKLFWIRVKWCTVIKQLSNFQALNTNLEEPLDTLSDPIRNREYVDICKRIKEAIGEQSRRLRLTTASRAYRSLLPRERSRRPSASFKKETDEINRLSESGK